MTAPCDRRAGPVRAHRGRDLEHRDAGGRGSRAVGREPRGTRRRRVRAGHRLVRVGREAVRHVEAGEQDVAQQHHVDAEVLEPGEGPLEADALRLEARERAELRVAVHHGQQVAAGHDHDVGPGLRVIGPALQDGVAPRGALRVHPADVRLLVLPDVARTAGRLGVDLQRPALRLRERLEGREPLDRVRVTEQGDAVGGLLVRVDAEGRRGVVEARVAAVVVGRRGVVACLARAELDLGDRAVGLWDGDLDDRRGRRAAEQQA